MRKKVEPTQLWTRVDWLIRREHWLLRLRPFIVNKNEECQHCQFRLRCHRVPFDSRVTAKIVRGEHCPYFKSVWKKILTNEEYDWGF